MADKKIGTNMESLALIEPLLPAGGNRVLTDLATQLWAQSSALDRNLHVATILGIGDLVRTMNCYYSNLLIEMLAAQMAIDAAPNPTKSPPCWLTSSRQLAHKSGKLYRCVLCIAAAR